MYVCYVWNIINIQQLVLYMMMTEVSSTAPFYGDIITGRCVPHIHLFREIDAYIISSKSFLFKLYHQWISFLRLIVLSEVFEILLIAKGIPKHRSNLYLSRTAVLLRVMKQIYRRAYICITFRQGLYCGLSELHICTYGGVFSIWMLRWYNIVVGIIMMRIYVHA